MKKLRLILKAFMASLILFSFIACENNEVKPNLPTPPIDNAPPSVIFNQGKDKVKIAPGTDHVIKGYVSSEVGLKEINLKQLIGDEVVESMLFDAFGEDNKIWKFEIPLKNLTVDTRLVVIAEDVEGRFFNANYDISIDKNMVKEMKIWQATLYNSQFYADGQSKGTFMSNSTGEVFAQAGSGDILSLEEQNKTDFLYSYDKNRKSSIISPNHSVAKNSATATQQWEQRNSTFFNIKKDVDWDNVDYDYLSKLQLDSGIDIVEGCKVGETFVFKTERGKVGLIKVEAINGTSFASSDNIRIEIKSM